MTTNNYLELKQKHEKEFNEFPKFFAFSQDQFNEGMKKLGLEPTDKDKIYSMGGGGFYRKTDSKEFKELIDRHEAEMSKAIQEDITGEGFIYNMFNYELSNHEYCYTRDIDSTLDALDLTIEEINNNTNLLKGLEKAIQYQIQNDY